MYGDVKVITPICPGLDHGSFSSSELQSWLTSNDRGRREDPVNKHNPLRYAIRRVAGNICDIEIDLRNLSVGRVAL